MERLANILHLGIKELRSLQHDLVLVLLILWAFSMGIYSAATKMPESLHNAAIAVVDEDQSQLSERLIQAFQAPYFRTPARIDLNEMDRGMDAGRYTFTLNIPPNFQRDVLAGRSPAIQLNVDATQVSMAFTGAGYIQNIGASEVAEFVRRYRGELSGSLAHELSQPLASIGNYGSALVRASEQALLTPDVVAYAAREITAEATRASGVLDGIRRLAKKRPCVREVQAMIPLAVQTIALFTGLLRAAPAVALVESVPVFAQMDALQIQQVLLNLLKNARDTQRDSPAPVPPIEVRITATEGVITVSVRDHGTPLTDAELAKIFDPFFTTKQEGLGLGLSICRTIIEAHGGALTACRAEEGVGLILSFTLPQAPSAT